MKILGIETSCDETAAAVVEDGERILSNVIASQVDIHARYGGVVPEVASRQHILSIIPVIEEAISKTEWGELSAIAATIGPGLSGSLIVGVNVAKAIAYSRSLPLIGVNHIEGHIYANWLSRPQKPDFPLLSLVVSGGHTELVLMKGHGDYLVLGKTRDDAVGEAFDKVARILGLGYPGGPAIERAAIGGNPSSYHLPRAWLKGSCDFSFSGLKTAVLRLVEARSDLPVYDLASSFQEAVVDVLVTKTVDAARRYHVGQILLAGGVAANLRLREAMAQRSPLPLIIPEPLLCTDNAAMIASCGYYRLMAGKVDGWDLDVYPNLKL